jgi:phage terminase large subunit GpA-like protein
MGAIDSIVFSLPALQKSFKGGVQAFAVPEPKTLDEWANEHFYLSAESSYVEKAWESWPFQRAILACMSNDDIEEVNWRKSARVGYTKCILACIGYTAHHKRRNQALWQPTDDDRDEFVKTELDPMLRDVEIMSEVISTTSARDKDNTLQQKKFKGSMLHLRGGKAAKNYRRISVDTIYLDEYDAFDSNIEKEGDPGDLAGKRVEGATFPKKIFGTTPKLKGFSNIEKRERNADVFMTYRVPCPHCGELLPITWGGKDQDHGFKWNEGDPESVRHLCPHHGCLFTQAEYLAVAERGIYLSADGETSCNHAGVFRNAAGEIIRAPRHVAFHVWSAYSPNVSWAGIVREFLEAFQETLEGKMEKMQTFTNTTRGEYWEQDIEKTDATEIQARAEPFALERVPMGCLLLLAGIDTQDNRLEVKVWGYGRGCEMWTIAYRVFFGNPSEDQVWQDLEEFLFDTEFPHASGTKVKIYAAAIDSRGHNTHAVYDWVAKHSRRRVFAIAGRSGREKHIKDGATKVDIDWRGRVRKNGAILWWVGTNHAKDLIYNRMQLTKPGPGYMHFSNELTDEYFKQMAGEVRTSRRTARGGEESAWMPIRKRVEAWDCTVYTIWLEYNLDIHKKPERFWKELEDLVQPAVIDLFDPAAAPAIATPSARPASTAKPPPPKPIKKRSAIASESWSSRK